MKRVFIISLFCILFSSCEVSLPVTFRNDSDFDVDVRVEGYFNVYYNFTVKSHSDYLLGCNRLNAPVIINSDKLPITYRYNTTHNFVISQLPTHKLNIKNITNQDINFRIKANYDHGTITSKAQSEDQITIYCSTLEIISEYNYFGINNNNGVFNLIFY